jgi:hypothetical protein
MRFELRPVGPTSGQLWLADGPLVGAGEFRQRSVPEGPCHSPQYARNRHRPRTCPQSDRIQQGHGLVENERSVGGRQNGSSTFRCRRGVTSGWNPHLRTCLCHRAGVPASAGPRCLSTQRRPRFFLTVSRDRCALLCARMIVRGLNAMHDI